MQGLSQVKNLVKSNGHTEAIKIYITALQNIDDFIAFLGLVNEDQVGSNKTHLVIGEAITLLLELANQHPADFKIVFDTLYNQYLKTLSSYDVLKPLQLYVTIMLIQVLSMFLKKPELDVTTYCDFYIDKYAKLGQELPDVYAGVFAEHCIFGYVQKREYQKAYKLEKHANTLLTLMSRDGTGLINYIAILVYLRSYFGEDTQSIVETLGLRFGEKEISQAIDRVKKEFESP